MQAEASPHDRRTSKNRKTKSLLSLPVVGLCSLLPRHHRWGLIVGYTSPRPI
ncbi:Uncharacterized protein TCM_036344 [Theobroma cacao]|uniref:Uncharacterized protein n=1 Tax=Theobroma cacao TaxID=3641 RepID=A0A061FKM0_THECC|nr:Uncharacterized protein TCM_036344 [Theobroma cacao]